MNQTLWTAVDRYICDHLVPTDDALDAALVDSAAAGLPAIHVAPNQGRLLALLAELRGARRILEVGTLGAYSTIWLGRALPPGGRLVTLEANAVYAEVARANLARAGLAEVVEIRVGKALETLPGLERERGGPFDFVFIDADKPNNVPYFEWALRLSRPGTLIVVDNVVRDGAIVDVHHEDANVQGTRRLYERMAEEPRVRATAVQTVGSKGYDGFAMAVVLGEA